MAKKTDQLVKCKLATRCVAGNWQKTVRYSMSHGNDFEHNMVSMKIVVENCPA